MTAILALTVAIVLFQLFFRYEYITPDGGRYIVRIDRLTGHMCDTRPHTATIYRTIYPSCDQGSPGP